MFDRKFISSALPEADVLYDTFPEEWAFSIDTRTLKKGDIFVAIDGQKTDGHNYVVDAVEKGAAGLIIDSAKKKSLEKINKKLLKNKLVILVGDTYQAVYRLAKVWRANFNIPVVGITGSIGKTSTREMVTNILQQKEKKFVATWGNYSSLLGLSLSLLKIRDHHEIGVFEVGISKRGDMSRAVDILRPTVAVITAVGHSHMEGLGALTDIASEKRIIFKYFNDDMVGIVNGDQAPVADVGYMHPVLKFGAKSTNQIQARKIRVNSDQITFILKIYKNKYPVCLQSSHEGRVVNALAAASICQLLNIDDQTIVEGLQRPLTVGRRFEWLPLKNGKGVLIDDSYNASPESLRAALLAVEHIKTEAYKIAVIGDMLELGVDSAFWHRQIGRFLRKTSSIQEVILVGKRVKSAETVIPSGIKVSLAKTSEEALSIVKKFNKKELLILIKGSRDMHLNAIVDVLAKRPISFSGAKRMSDESLKEEPLSKQVYT